MPSSHDTVSRELHVFCDASACVYAACAALRTVNSILDIFILPL